MELKGKKVLVIGAGKSGIAATRLLLRHGAEVVLADSQKIDLPPFPGKVHLVQGGYPSAKDFDLLVLSPGVPLTVPPVREAEEAGIEIVGELELAFRFARAPVVAVTGTNGKTTTTALTGAIFQAAGLRTWVAGNIGLPLSEVVEEAGPEDVLVVEVSSFQLETTSTFRPAVAVILNLTPDHLDRHGDFSSYRRAKARIFARQTDKEVTVLNYDDPEVRSMAAETRGQVLFFSRRHKLATGVWVAEGAILVKWEGVEGKVAEVAFLALPGAHNLENALAATAAAVARNVPLEVIGRVLREFKGVAHRLELVAEINGVKYVNDSKGTNPEATIKALEAYDCPIVLIAGGRNKGSDFRLLVSKMKEKVKALVLIGESAPLLAAQAKAAGMSDIILARDLPEAVRRAREKAQPGDVVLLSPACASWDMFRNYEERGECFRQAVKELVQEETGIERG
ncbi:UDP-N-acetylmuramoyl-L-alanine--D-glutamate ligase [Ammonifex thiophilus]|uniref:UDP-N-acetylmuramoylalanine--D-glutamate ligase n=1 Tax=Ammonifex thiophilus TaxID=444093 RepID=A0A3D8P2W2_9THEO|nr:UDP-N-acetylmuramoyl-L-alanine--D-glutamate ligase [Ammonifex thiophilus]RDV82901.1 UDP-N-acetylmuramoyl-L-alanine--D-glutamate ligase [Ammonifex thiophilus]